MPPRLATVLTSAVIVLAIACADASASTRSAVDKLSLSQLAGQRAIFSYSGKDPPP